MDDRLENGIEIYMQDGVVVRANSMDNVRNTDLLTSGCLSVVDYKSELGYSIEWCQNDISIQTDYNDWAIVDEIKPEIGSTHEKTKNPKNVIRIPLQKLKLFKVNLHSKQLTFCLDNSKEVVFHFHHGDINKFLKVITNVLPTLTKISQKDVDLYIAQGVKEVQALEKSFNELDIFSDDKTKSDAIWSFIKKMHDRPYETTMTVFCKVTDIFSYKPFEDDVRHEISDSYNKSKIDNESALKEYEFVQTPLPPRTIPNRTSPLSHDIWISFLDENGRISEEQLVKEIIFHGGVSPESDLRSEVWKFLLGYYPWNSTFNEREVIKMKKREEYFTMKSQWKAMTQNQENNFIAYKERKSLIEKDVCRTDRNLPFFAGDNNKNLEKLQNILMTYVMYNFDLGYVQGMSDLLSPLLVQLNDEVDAFWCFVGFMNKVYRNFDLDQAGMKEQLSQLYHLLNFLEPQLATYLEHQESDSMAFCFRWLLIWFKREFSFEEISTLWEVLWSEALCKNFHLLICTAILDAEKKNIMSNKYGLTEILKHINELANHMDLNLILRKSEGIYYQLFNAAKIPGIIADIIGVTPKSEAEQDRIDSNKAQHSCDNCAQQSGTKLESNLVTMDVNELAFDTSMNFHYL